MKMLSALFIVGAAVGGYHLVSQHHAAGVRRQVLADSDVNGFLEVPMPANQQSDTIYVVAAQNCPHEAAQRADQLAQKLGAKGLPVNRTSQVSFNPRGIDAATLERLKVVMESPLPLVFVRGRAASNPDADQVVSEFRRSEMSASN
jgi:hypothetical protein